MIDRIKKLLALDHRQRRVVVAAAVLMPLCELAIHLVGFPRVRGLFGKMKPLRASSLSPAEVARGVRIAMQHSVIPVKCLSHALCLQRALARHGHDSKLRIGVRRAGPSVEAHAWIEVDGEPLDENPGTVERFAAFESEIPAGTA